MVKMLGRGGGGSPLGRRQWVGINVCHPEVVKLQQQCHMLEQPVSN